MRQAGIEVAAHFQNADHADHAFVQDGSFIENRINDATDASSSPLAKEGHRGVALRSWAMAILFIVAIAYGSLLPFQIKTPTVGFADWFSPARLTLARPTLEDVVTNLLLYVPVGAAFLSIVSKRIGMTLRVALATILGGSLSLLIEMTQANLADRVASWVDVALNTFGAACGAWAWQIALIVAPSIRARMRTMGFASPAARIGLLLVAGLLAYQLAPFNLITSTAQLESSLRRASILHWPWAGSQGVALLDASQAGALVLFMLVGYFGTLALVERDPWFARMIELSLLSAFALALVCEVLQLFVRSRAFDGVDILLNTMAGLVGAVLAIRRFQASTSVTRGPVVSTRLLWLMLVVALGAVIGRAFVVSGKSNLAALPFEALWRQPMALAASAMMNLTFVHVTLVWCMALLFKRTTRIARPWFMACIATVGLSILAECVHVVRVHGRWLPDLTSPLLGAAAVTIAALWYPSIRRMLMAERMSPSD